MRERLLGNSTANDVDEARKAWVFQDRVVDHGKGKARCELCGNTNLRYHFLIAQRETGEVMWVGSQCITQFGVDFYSRNGVRIRTEKARKNAVKYAVKAEQLYALMQPLHALFEGLSREQQRRVRWIVGKFDQRGGFAPDELDELFYGMEQRGIAYDAALYPVTLRSKQDKAGLRKMTTTGLRRIWGSLTEKQREMVSNKL